jgi:hypothetical protein
MSSEAENDRDAAVRQRKTSAKYAILCLAVLYDECAGSQVMAAVALLFMNVFRVEDG